MVHRKAHASPAPEGILLPMRARVDRHHRRLPGLRRDEADDEAEVGVISNHRRFPVFMFSLHRPQECAVFCFAEIIGSSGPRRATEVATTDEFVVFLARLYPFAH